MISNIFEIEWLKLESDMKKDFLTLIKCGSIPIEFTSAYIIPMNIDSFMAVSTNLLDSIIMLLQRNIDFYNNLKIQILNLIKHFPCCSCLRHRIRLTIFFSRCEMKVSQVK